MNVRNIFVEQVIKLLEASSTQLRVGIFKRLSEKYFPLYGKQKGEFLSVALINKALIEKPSNTEAKNFCVDNLDLINEESEKLSEDIVTAHALSYLYATEILYLAIINKDPFSARSFELSEQA